MTTEASTTPTAPADPLTGRLTDLLLELCGMVCVTGEEGPIADWMADRYGRRPILSLSLLGALIGYLLFAIAIVQQHIWLLFFSRLLPGFAGGNISIVLTAIADVSAASARSPRCSRRQLRPRRA